VLVWMLTVALAAPSPSRPPPPHGPGHPPGPPPPELLVERAADAGVASETVAEMQRLLDVAAPGLEEAHEDTREGHDTLRALLTGSAHPDRRAVLAASRALADAESRMRELHLSLELDLRALLTEAEWSAVRPPPPPGGFRPEAR
jgi:hypothetical protein